HEEESDPGDPLRLEGRAIGQLGERAHRAQVRVETQATTKLEQARLRALLRVVPFRPAHRAEEDGVGRATRFDRLRRERLARLVDRLAADQVLAEEKLVPEL